MTSPAASSSADRYAVFGHPIAHSKSPRIHQLFAAQTGQALTYEAILAPVDGFRAAVTDFMATGGRGANVTVPFKEQAWALCAETPNTLSDRARLAGAVNTLTFSNGLIHGDNTDGAGLLADLTTQAGCFLKGSRILLLGAGGAARGVLEPLLAQQPSLCWIANRTPAKAQALADLFAHRAREAGASLKAGSFDDLTGLRFDLVINATASSLGGESLPLPSGLYAPGALAYDMMYGLEPTPFLQQARADHADRIRDGLGMLVGQAAEAFALWRGVRPDPLPVLKALRAS